jgi:GMP synthase-like glutamine amidotransferase
MKALVLQHGDWGPPGLLADWAAARGIPLDIHRADLGEPLPELNGQAFVASSAPDVVPEGPWLQWHFDCFTLPPGATELARSEVAVQAFTHGPHLGVQFHPESTIEIVRSWAWTDRGRVSALGIEDGEALLERGRHHAEPAAQAAFDLFDAFWERTRT